MADGIADMRERVERMVSVLDRVESKVDQLNGYIREIQTRSAEHEIRIGRIEQDARSANSRGDKIQAEIEQVRQHIWRISIGIALAAGAGMAVGERALSFLLP